MELTTEEKAKAYDKVREKIALRFGSNVAEEIFSVFEESEDERIRKELIDAIRGLWINDALPMPLSVKRKDEWLAWLEKQAKLVDEYEDKLDRCACESFNKGYKAAIEHQKEKSADKVEPKFHEGEWIVKNDSGIGQHIKEIVNVNDETLYVFDEDKVLDVNFQEQYHLWTIKDAKDGDVLAHNGLTFIFKGIEDGIVKGLCLGLSDSILNFGEPEYDKDYHPATKEQRNALIKVMADAGYIFDFEKKELKKIEQKSWSEDDEKLAQAKKDAYNDTLDKIEYHSGEPTFDDGWDAAIWYLKKRNIQPRSKQKWSEEDEKMFDKIIGVISQCYFGRKPEVTMDYINWLKSLKERIG